MTYGPISKVPFEIRSAELDGNTLSGIVHAYGVRALVGNTYEQFAAGAFDSVLSREDADIRSFWNHNTDLLLGRTTVGTLHLFSDEEGLHYAIDLPETTYAEDLKALVQRGDLDGMSFGFIPETFQKLTAPDGRLIRLHTRVRELIEVSPVSLPAFAGTTVQLHSATYEVEEQPKSQVARARVRVLTKRAAKKPLKGNR